MKSFRVKSDALFSYQPPFNILAFLLLKPASWVLSPRALHSFNVFLIRSTSFPILVVLRTYECYLTDGQMLRETGRDAAYLLLNKLPRHIKTMPLVEALVGSTASGLYDAIFDANVTEDSGLFNQSDDEQSFRPRSQWESPLSSPSPTPRIRKEPPSPSHTIASGAMERLTTRLRVQSALSPADVPHSEDFMKSRGQSPLTKLFTNRPSTEAQLSETGWRRIQTLLDDVRAMPVQRLREEMKELQVRTHFLETQSHSLTKEQERQARIENLLLVLTRGMRNDSSSK